jgi:hypothetical protein
VSRRYAILFGAIVLGALALTALARLPQRPPAAESMRAEAPVAEVAIEIRDGVVNPGRVTVAKGHRVRLRVLNRDANLARLDLGGYGDVFPTLSIAAGDSARAAFVADLPGEDFPWFVNGEPAGQLVVRGSHLVEGHR